MPGKELPVDNITACFGADLVSDGSTSIPNLLLKYYNQLKISDQELVLIIQLIFLRNTQRDFYPTTDKISQYMSATCEEIKEMLASLIEKQFLDIDKRYIHELEEIKNCYSLAPLLEELSCLWALEKQQNLLELQKHMQNSKLTEFNKVCKCFEREFGRLLSPVEVDQIRYWVEDAELASDLVLEALRRAILMGVHNLKYIDKILLEWQKNHLVTMDAVLEYEANNSHKAVKTPKNKKINEKNDEKNDDKFQFIHWGNMGGSA